MSEDLRYDFTGKFNADFSFGDVRQNQCNKPGRTVFSSMQRRYQSSFQWDCYCWHFSRLCVSFRILSLFYLIEVCLRTAPSNYNFGGTRAITVIDPVDTIDPERRHESKDEEKQESEADTSPDSPTNSSVIQRNKEVSVEELQRVFRRALWPSLILTLIVMVVRVFNQYTSLDAFTVCVAHRSFLYRCSSRTTCSPTLSSVSG